MWTSFRSASMSFYNIFVSKDAAYACLRDLAESELIEIAQDDILSGSKKYEFTEYVKRCYDLEQILEKMIEKCAMEEIVPMPCEIIPKAPSSEDFGQLEREISNINERIITISASIDPLKSDYYEMYKMKCVFDFVRAFLNEEDEMWDVLFYTDEKRHQGEPVSEIGSLSILAGFIPPVKAHACEVTLWRLTRGNVIFRYTDFIAKPLYIESKDIAPQIIFILLIYGNDFTAAAKQICMGYGCIFLPIPQTKRERAIQYFKLMREIKHISRVIDKSTVQLRDVLLKLNTNLCCFMLKVKKMKLIFVALNEFSTVSQLLYVFKCWIPVEKLSRAKHLVNKNHTRNVPAIFDRVVTNKIPPTYIHENKITKGFQTIINSYGVPSYKEMNPTAFTMITFPFLFAVMFGDVGHGIVVVLLTTWVVVKESTLKKIVRKSEIYKLLFGGRYMILLMGIFSVYVGIIYNCVFSRPVNMIGSSWKINYNASTIMSNEYLTLDPTKDYIGKPYWLGQDPIWCAGGPENLPVLNSFKMKMSIVFGVVQMIFGIFVGISNKLYFKDKAGIWLESVPSLIFLCGLFFYLVILIFFKWSFFGGKNTGAHSAACAPLILIAFINMVMFKPAEEAKEGCSKYFYDYEPIIEKTLAIISFAMVPIMMFGKPIYIHRQRKKKLRRPTSKNALGGSASIDDMEEEPMSDVIIHQLIHTIESVLGSVSHTASYLRLWALGLAHEQLSSVIWDMVLVKTLGIKSLKFYYGGILLFLTFGAWACLTLAILVFMEGLSAFLHTLRLHWIEFQSRFYQGTGQKFTPISFNELYQENDSLIHEDIDYMKEKS